MYYLWLGLGFHGSFKLRQDLETILSDKLANNHNRDLSIYTEDEQEAISLMAFFVCEMDGWGILGFRQEWGEQTCVIALQGFNKILKENIRNETPELLEFEKFRDKFVRYKLIIDKYVKDINSFSIQDFCQSLTEEDSKIMNNSDILNFDNVQTFINLVSLYYGKRLLTNSKPTE